MIALLALALLATPSSELRESFLSGDLVTFERARAFELDQGIDVEVGEPGLLGDLARLGRCLPLGPIPLRESRKFRALRTLVRIERVRLEALMRDGDYADTAIAELLVEPPLYEARVLDRARGKVVRWPIEDERWGAEVIDPIPEAARCPVKPAAMRESNAKQHGEHQVVRARVLREYIASAVGAAADLPPEAAARVAYTYLADASEAGLHLPKEWRTKLAAHIFRGEPPIRSAGMITLARMDELANDLESARDLFQQVLRDDSRTDEEDSRARARLVGLEEPSFDAVLAVVRGVPAGRALRDEDRVVFDNAEARALYALGRWSELETFGRVWLRSGPGEDPFEVMTRDLLLRVGLQLEPAEAMSWALELGAGDPTTRVAQLDALGRLAVESGSLELATAVYDRLRIESQAARSKIGPSAAADEARWIAERALIELLEEDAESFGGLVDDIVELARREKDRPLARHAPHKELARLCQNVLPRLANEVASKPDHRKFAAVLLEATVELTKEPGRWKTVLESFMTPLETLAGEYAKGRTRPPPAAAAKKRKPEKRVRMLGEVVVPRLPPRLEAPDYPTVLPEIDSYVVYPDERGRLQTGAPWRPLAEKRKAAGAP